MWRSTSCWVTGTREFPFQSHPPNAIMRPEFFQYGKLLRDGVPHAPTLFAGITQAADLWYSVRPAISGLVIAMGYSCPLKVKGANIALHKASKAKKNAALCAWMSSIRNHLWWAAQTCGGDAEVMQERIRSILYHVQ